MAILIGGDLAVRRSRSRVFEKHLASWIRRFFVIWSVKSLTLRLAWLLGRTFIYVETEASPPA